VTAKYRTQVCTDLARIDAQTWNALLARDGSGTPFLRHEFLHALHTSGAATPRTGWAPQFITLWQGEALVAAAPLYLKAHSYGEYVFDWAWADACARHGQAYYPKALVAVPFTPVGGTRLLAVDAAARRALAETLFASVPASELSSLHVLFPPADQVALLESLGGIVRHGVQFHWHNGSPEPLADFEAFLALLAQPKRKKIRAERRKVHDAGVTLIRKTGRDITAADWAFFVRCYDHTYAAHGSSPYLNLDFFAQIGAQMPEHLLLVLALRGGQPIAASLGVFDGTRLYGRHWGEVEHVPCLHFECCYYQMIEFAIERRLAVFEGGAQGAHKMARGLDPVPTRSVHWLTDPALHAAVERFVTREAQSVDHTLDELNEHRAWRRDAGVPQD
jgi:predicted N-acyltransferase